jgi:uncharacterized cupredoxin-like copper-binding protein
MVTPRFTRRLALIALPAALALILVLVLGGSSAGAKTTLRLKAVEKGGLRFNKKTIRTSPGKVTISMKSQSSLKFPHAIEVEGKGSEKKGKTVRPGGTSKVTLTLKKGTYEFYCPVPGHRQAGMKGKIVVK